MTYYCPAATTIVSDFLCLSAVGLLAARQSPLNLAVFNSSYRILWLCQIFSGALASAICIQVGMALGGSRISDAKHPIKVGMTICIGIIFFMSAVVLQYPVALARIFSNDEDILQEFSDSRRSLAFTMVAMNVAIVLKKIVMNLGYTHQAFHAGVVGAWGGQVPSVLFLTHSFENNMFWLYMGVACGYTLLCLILTSFLVCCDWDDVVHLATERSERKNRTLAEGERNLNTITVKETTEHIEA
jgi:MATE family multidrug resistance protein